jgi:hypothetical protein
MQKKRKINSLRKKNCQRYQLAFEQSYPLHIPRHSRGNCGLVAELIAESMIRKGLYHYKVVEGTVKFSNGRFHNHTWMEYGGFIYDPCLRQFRYYGDDYNLTSVKYFILSKTPAKSYLKYCKSHPLPEWYVQDVINNRLKSSRFIPKACIVTASI